MRPDDKRRRGIDARQLPGPPPGDGYRMDSWHLAAGIGYAGGSARLIWPISALRVNINALNDQRLRRSRGGALAVSNMFHTLQLYYSRLSCCPKSIYVAQNPQLM